MTRLRFFRILLPALLLPFLVLLALMVRERPTPKIGGAAGGVALGPRAEKVDLTDLAGGAKRYEVKARVVQTDEKGNSRFEGIDRLVVYRADAPPLVASADRGRVEGGERQRIFRLEGGVRVQEEERGLLVSLPTLVIDQPAGEARSIGEVLFRDGDDRGRAASVVYGLKAQPSTLQGLELTGPEGLSLTCERARLLDGTKDVELSGTVRVRRGGASLDAGFVKLLRGADRKLRYANATEKVTGSSKSPDSPDLRFAAEHAEMKWDEAARPSSLLLEGDAVVSRGESNIAAPRIEAVRGGLPDDAWHVHASGGVSAAGLWQQGPARLGAESLVAEVDPKGGLRSADLQGSARFDGGGSAAEAARIFYEPEPAPGHATLTAGPDRRARLARERSRVAADRIVTDLEGNGFRAEGKVEATLLGSGETAGGASAGGLFRTGEAVHFVSSSMDGQSSGGHLVFEGAVRGWQGERNLSADRVEVKQKPDELHASGHVASRLPRTSAAVLSESDYVRITSEHLDYSAEQACAVYTGGVRVRQAEGWLEAESVDVFLASGSSSVREVTAEGKIRLEFRSPAAEGMPEPVVGDGDRVVYSPEERTVRLFGDAGPATLRRTGPDGGTTTGRVLRYRLDAGTIEVESGDRNRARIRSTGK